MTYPQFPQFQSPLQSAQPMQHPPPPADPRFQAMGPVHHGGAAAIPGNQQFQAPQQVPPPPAPVQQQAPQQPAVPQSVQTQGAVLQQDAHVLNQYQTAVLDERARREAAERELQTLRSKATTAEQYMQQMGEYVRQQTEQQARLTHELNMRDYRLRLATYRDQVVSAYGEEIIADMVRGETPEEIDRAAVAAHQRYLALRQKFSANAGAGLPPIPAAPQMPPATMGVPQQSPHFVPQGVQYQQPQGFNPANGFPTPTNPFPPMNQQQAGVQDFSGITTEEAVRSGQFGSFRQQLHNSIRNGGVPGMAPPGVLPRHVAQQMQRPQVPQFQAPPQGFQQPQAPQFQVPQGPMVQHPQAAFQPPPGFVDPAVAQAQASVQRAHQGALDPRVTAFFQQQGINDAMQAAQMQNPAAAQAQFQQRFAVSPQGQ